MMRYSKDPITEAVFEIQVELPKNDIKILEQLCDDIKDEYPKKEPILRGNIDVKADLEVKSLLVKEGFRAWSADKKQVLQFRVNAFGFSRLKPYNNWDEHFSEVMKYWKLYSERTSQFKIKRIAVRFINVIELPMNADLKNYFLNHPNTPVKKANLNGFYYQTEFSIPEEKIEVIIKQALAKSNDGVNKAIILDIETFREITSSIDEEGIVEIFSLLRKVKNDFFDKSLLAEAKKILAKNEEKLK